MSKSDFRTRLEELLEDFLPYRSLDTGFVATTTEFRIARWGVYFPSYIKELTGSAGIKRLIAWAYKGAQSVISTITIPKKARVLLSNKVPTGATDGGTIYLSTSFFSEDSEYPFIENEDKVFVLYGLAAHEAYHVRYTDFEKFKVAEDLFLNESELALYRTLTNIIEDERIEYLGSLEFPGYSGFVAACKEFFLYHQYMRDIKNIEAAYKERLSKIIPSLTVEKDEISDLFDELSPEAKKDSAAEIRDKYYLFIDVLLRIIRFPVAINEEVLSVVEAPIIEAVNILKRYPSGFPATFEEVHEACLSIIEMLREIWGSLPPPEKKDALKDLCEVVLVKTSPISAPTTEAAKEIEERYTADIFEGDVETPMGGVDAYVSASGDVEPFKDNNVYFIHPEFSPDMVTNFAHSLGAVKPFSGSLRNLLRFTQIHEQTWDKNKLSGKLNSTAFVKAVTGSPDIYREITVKDSKRKKFVFLIDESGSMEGESIVIARNVAVLAAEIFSGNVDVELYIYGFSADQRYTGATEIYVYREHGRKRPKELIAGSKARSENRDGDSILAVAKRVKKVSPTEGPAVMFVLSDGAPAAVGYGGDSAIEDTRQKVFKAEQLGFTVIQIAINSRVPSEKMFKKYVKFDHYGQLLRELSKLVRTEYMRNL